MSGEALKPCPFCGLNDALTDIDGAGLVKCRRCWVADPDTGEVGVRPWGLRFADDVVNTRAEAAEQRAEAAEQRVERMLSEVRKVVERANRDAENARKHRLEWSEAAGCEAQMARSLLARLERAAKAEGADR
jgi:hypothetical protein